jgi:hypothetical protein
MAFHMAFHHGSGAWRMEWPGDEISLSPPCHTRRGQQGGGGARIGSAEQKAALDAAAAEAGAVQVSQSDRQTFSHAPADRQGARQASLADSAGCGGVDRRSQVWFMPSW